MDASKATDPDASQAAILIATRIAAVATEKSVTRRVRAADSSGARPWAAFIGRDVALPSPSWGEKAYAATRGIGPT